MSTVGRSPPTRSPLPHSFSRNELNVVLGGVSGVCGTIAGQPLDSLKIYRQIASSGRTAVQASLYAQLGGWRGLMKGCVPACVSRFAITGSSFSLLSTFRAALAQWHPILFPLPSAVLPPGSSPHAPLWTTFTAATLAGVCLTWVTAPFELIKVQMQASATHLPPAPAPLPPAPSAVRPAFPAWRGSVHCTADLLQRHGLGVFGRGLGATAGRSTLFWGTYYTAYEWTTAHFNGLSTEVGFNDVGSARTSAVVLGAGALAGALAWWLILPVDLIKTRLQSQSFDRPARYRGVADCVQQTYAAGGVRAFYTGGAATVSRAMLVNAIVFWAYEAMFKLCDPSLCLS